MLEYTRVLNDVGQTVGQMKRLASDYRDDIAPFSFLNLSQFFFYLKCLPFIPDPPGEEYLNRPISTLTDAATYRDCDCKAIALMAYCLFFGIPARFCATSDRTDEKLHHIYVEVFINGHWSPLDPTYPENKILWERPFTRKEIF
jgi:hypothetical protein